MSLNFIDVYFKNDCSPLFLESKLIHDIKLLKLSQNYTLDKDLHLVCNDFVLELNLKSIANSKDYIEKDLYDKILSKMTNQDIVQITICENGDEFHDIYLDWTDQEYEMSNRKQYYKFGSNDKLIVGQS